MLTAVLIITLVVWNMKPCRLYMFIEVVEELATSMFGSNIAITLKSFLN
jgi:hypothetical protein